MQCNIIIQYNVNCNVPRLETFMETIVQFISFSHFADNYFMIGVCIILQIYFITVLFMFSQVLVSKMNIIL